MTTNVFKRLHSPDMPRNKERDISGGFSKVGRWIGDLLVPWQWTEGTITDFLNADTEEDRRRLTNLFVTTTLTNYNTIGVTVSGVRSASVQHANVGRPRLSPVSSQAPFPGTTLSKLTGP